MSCAPTLCAERTAEDESDSSVGMGMVCFDMSRWNTALLSMYASASRHMPAMICTASTG